MRAYLRVTWLAVLVVLSAAAASPRSAAAQTASYWDPLAPLKQCILEAGEAWGNCSETAEGFFEELRCVAIGFVTFLSCVLE